MKKFRIIVNYCALVLLLSSLFLNGCNSSSNENPTLQDSEPSSGINIILSMSEPPLLNVPVELTWTVWSHKWDLPDSNAEVRLPEGASLVDGELTWHGDLIDDVPVSFNSTIVFNQTGRWTIEGVAKHQTNETDGEGDSDFIFVNVGTKKNEFGWPTSSEVSMEQTDD